MTHLPLLRSRSIGLVGIVSLAIGLVLLFAACNHEPNVTEIRYSDTSGGTIFLLTQPKDYLDDNDAEIEGTLVLIDGCLRIANASRPDRFPAMVWPKGFSAAINGEDVLIVDTGGAPVARVGDRIRAGGSSGWDSDARYGGCSGPFWSTRNNDSVEVVETAMP